MALVSRVLLTSSVLNSCFLCVQRTACAAASPPTTAWCVDCSQFTSLNCVACAAAVPQVCRDETTGFTHLAGGLLGAINQIDVDQEAGSVAAELCFIAASC